MTARIAAALIALTAFAALAIQFAATYAQGYGVAATLAILARYFTVLTNLAVAILFTALAAGRPVQPMVLGGAVLAIMLVGIVYMTLLRGLVELSGGAWLADLLLHKVTPLLVPAWYLAFAPKGGLRWRDPVAWMLYPLVYLVYALGRGAMEGQYAYPFIDLAALGAVTVAVNAGALAAAFLLAGFGLVALDRHLGSRLGRPPTGVKAPR